MTTTTAQNFTKSQRRAVKSVLRFLRERNDHNGVTSVRFAAERVDSRMVSVTFRTRRSDCDRFSPRAVVCEQYVHIIVTQRGRITVCSANDGLTKIADHVAYMIGGRTM